MAQAKVIITGESKDAQRAVKDFDKKVKDIGKTVSDVGKKMTMFVTGPLVALGAAVIKLGSDAEETQSKFNVVFRGMAEEVNRWAEAFADSVGRARTDVKAWMATLQDTFVPLGFARDEAAEFSKQLTQLTVDLASFNNMAEPEVLRALQSAIVGNHEAVRQFGVVITQATLNQELLNMGIKDGVQAATEAQKAQARLNIIMKSTVDAQGDAIRTADETANKVRRLKGQVKNLGEEFSKFLIPTFDKFVGYGLRMAEMLNRLDDNTKQWLVQVAALVAAIGPLAWLIGSLIKNLSLLISPVTLVVAAIAGLATAAVLVYRNWEEVKGALVAIWQYIAASAGKLSTQAQLEFYKLKKVTLEVVNSILERLGALEKIPYIGEKFKGLKDAIGGSIDGTAEKISELENKLAEADQQTKDAVDNMKVSFADAGEAIKNDILGIIELVKAESFAVEVETINISENLQKRFEAWQQYFENLKQKQQEAVNTAIEAQKKRYSAWQEHFQKLYQAAVDNQAKRYSAWQKYYEKRRRQREQEINDAVNAQQTRWSLIQQKLENEQRARENMYRAMAEARIQTSKAVNAAIEEQAKKEAIILQGRQGIIETFANNVSDYMKALQDNTVKASESAAEAIVGFIDSVSSGRKTFKEAMKEMLISMITSLEKQIIAHKLAAEAIAWAQSIWTFGASLAALGAALAKILPALAALEVLKAGIRGLAEGGTLLSSGAVMVGERGPEILNLPKGARVTPLDKVPRGGNITININNPRIDSGIDIDRIGNQLVRKLKMAGVVIG